MPQPGVEPGLQSSQDCVLSIERLEHRSMQYMKLFSKNKLFLAICNHFHIVYQVNNQKKLLFLLLKKATFTLKKDHVNTKIKTELAKHINLASKTGVFFSAFDSAGQLLAANGVIKTDRAVELLVDSFCTGILNKYWEKIKRLIFDLVTEIRIQNDPNELIKVPMHERGVFLVQWEDHKSWVLLPNTKWIDTIQQALSAIKQKYGLSSQVSVYLFKTIRVEIPL